MKTSSTDEMSRRALLATGAAALSTTALSYGRILGSNERISLGAIGVGNRGRELASIAAGLKHSHNVEMTAVCDLWKLNRERAAATATSEYGRAPRSFAFIEDLLGLNDVDRRALGRQFIGVSVA